MYIQGTYQKLSLFADDLTVFQYDPARSLCHLLNLFDFFGMYFSQIEFGIQQQMNLPNEVCEVKEENINSCRNTDDFMLCQKIFTDQIFSSCKTLIDPYQYTVLCFLNLCLCKEENRTSCLCSIITEFSRQCALAGGKPGNWRTPDLCPRECPQNLEYQECGSPCGDSCSNPDSTLACDQHCVDGCYCPEGLLFDDIGTNGCIAIENCSCTYNGHSYIPGASYSTSDRSCTCSSGKWQCEFLPCSATCAIEGGSHITTFDEMRYTAYGDCYYVFSKLCTQSLFTVLGELRPCGKKETETCLVGVTVILNDEETIIELNPSGDVYVNFIYTQLPISAASFTIFRPSPLYIVLNTNFGLQIISQIIPIMQLYVVLEPSYTSQTCGLCGNYNNRQSDEFKIISGIVEGTAVSFINTWKTEANCPSANIVFDHPCSISVESEVYAKHWCGLLLDPDDVFGPCHILVNPNIYYQNCLIDTCSCEKSEECMCAALASYAKLCAANGVVLYGWRQKACYKYTQCPNNLVFSYSVTSYQPTCRSISEPDMICKVIFDPLEGCVCNKGYYLDKSGKCVPAISCPCYYRGLPIPSGESINDRGVICTCNKGNLTCIGGKKPTAICTAPMVFVDCSKSEPGTNGAECFKSCQTLDLQCYSTRCKSGCVCPPGLVSDENGGCIDPINCPCIHNEAIYNTGDEIKIRCNTCVCKDRMWKCTNNTCLSTCTVYGDGHYITFDGKRYSFNGDCQYTLAEDYCNLNSSESNFRIITENIACGTTGTTCSKSIKIFLGTFELILADDHLNVIERGFGVPVPYRVRLMGIYLVIETKSGLLLLWDKKTSIFIKVSSEYKGKLCGLCGNYDGNRNNDFTTRGNAVVASADEFGNSWKMSTNCPDAKDTKDPCIINPYRQSWAQKQCSIINSNVFSACHPHVDPLKYYEACVSDSCACNTGGDCECFCTAVAAYALACGDLGICISWRTPIICPLFCDYYNRDGNCEWHYKACGSHCMKTCRNPMGKCSYEIRGLEGCYPKCPEDKPYFDEDEMECVSVCGCYDGDRKHYKLGAIVPTNENCTVCFCTLNGIECKYKVEACKCEYQGKIYKYNEVIYNTTDNIGGCIIAICKENGTIYREVHPCPTVSTTSVRTTPLEFTTESSTGPWEGGDLSNRVCCLAAGQM
ncbi:mucin-5AC [Bombina bombina]|uniref:mucin-5AC n=1 Tax=Bombina bombina TaxID=8345 RepID=UPI00235AA242|nr:mucin-5AC [Bombina bombina]